MRERLRFRIEWEILRVCVSVREKMNEREKKSERERERVRGCERESREY